MFRRTSGVTREDRLRNEYVRGNRIRLDEFRSKAAFDLDYFSLKNDTKIMNNSFDSLDANRCFDSNKKPWQTNNCTIL